MGLGQSMTGGERLNNPGNLIHDGSCWPGLLPPAKPSRFGWQDEQRLCHFDTPAHGIGALCTVLLSYQRLKGCWTLGQLMRRWLAAGDDDIEAHLAQAEKRTGIAEHGPVDLDRPGDLATVAQAIIACENGRCIYDDGLIAEAAAATLAR